MTGPEHGRTELAVVTVAAAGALALVVAVVLIVHVIVASLSGGAEWVIHAYPAYMNSVHQQVTDVQRSGGQS
jgi:hypothetical protein